MTSRERVLRAFGKSDGLPDRPPLQFDLCRSLIEEFGRRLSIAPDYSLSYYEDLTYRISANEIRVALGSDVVTVGGTVAAGYLPLPVEGHSEDDTDSSGITLNEFEMHMKPTDLYVEVVKCPLADASDTDDVIDYNFPSAFALGRFDKAKRDIDLYGESHYVIGDCELSIFELAWHLTGMEKYMMAFAMEEQWIELLNDRVEAWTLGLARQLVELGVDAVWFGEDLGTQSSMLISPDMWRERLKPRYIRMIRMLREINPDVHIIMHSDGAVAPLIEDFIEMGIHIYNPVQPNVPGSDPAELVEKYGGRICFFGGIDQQELLPTGDINALETELHRRARIMGRGYLMAPAHIIQADTIPETVEAMIRIVRDMGH
jgi:uroporphyrinogen decarboxylase